MFFLISYKITFYTLKLRPALRCILTSHRCTHVHSAHLNAFIRPIYTKISHPPPSLSLSLHVSHIYIHPLPRI